MFHGGYNVKKMVYGATIKLSYENQNGIMKKVFSESKAFSDYFEVCIWGFTDSEIIYIENEKITHVCKFHNKRERRQRYFQYLTKYVIDNNIKAFYFRYATTDFYLLYMLKCFKKNNVVSILEIPTYPYKGEFKLSLRHRLIYALDCVLRGYLKRYVHRIAVVGEGYDKIFGIPCICFQNGVDFSEIELNEPIKKNEIGFIAVGTMLIQHGFDRMITGISQYYQSNKNPRNIKVYIVGVGPMLQYYKLCSQKYGVDKHIEFCGFRTGEELNKIYSNSICAVGALGLHKIGLLSSSALKHREYVAKGMPIVYAANDVLLENSQYAFQIPPDDSPVNVENVIKWLDKLYVKNDVNLKIREKNANVCDMKKTMAPIIKTFLDALTGNK